MSQALQEILDRIQGLPAEERIMLEDRLAEQAEAEWQREAEDARRMAQLRGIDQSALDRAVERIRHGS